MSQPPPNTTPRSGVAALTDHLPDSRRTFAKAALIAALICSSVGSILLVTTGITVPAAALCATGMISAITFMVMLVSARPSSPDA